MSDGSPDTIDTQREDPNIDQEGIDHLSTANTMRERAGESRLKVWFFLEGSRLLISVLLGLLIFGVFVLGGSNFYQYVLTDTQTGDTIETVFSTMISAIITGVTLVLTITQIVISQENGPLGEQRERMSDTMDFRDYTEELIGAPTPADPSAFLRSLILESKDCAETLREEVAESANDELREELDEFTTSLINNADTAAGKLDGQSFGTFTVLSGALDFNYSWKVFQTERLADYHQDSISNEVLNRLDELKVILSMIGPAREHIKTLYFEWELISLTQNILYVSVPALIVAGFMTTFVSGSSLPGVTLGVSNLIWVVSIAFAATTIPFLLLISYIARVATVAKRTLAIGPFLLRDSQR